MELTGRRLAAALIGVLVVAAGIAAIVLATRGSGTPSAGRSPSPSAAASVTASPSAATPSPTPPPTASATTAGTPGCSAAQLAFALGSTGAAGGADHVLLRITNGSAPTCTIGGYVTVQFSGASGPITISDADTPGLVASSPSPQPITLRPGVTAGFLLSWQQGPVDPAGHACPVASSLILTTANAPGTGVLGAHTADGVQISPCGNSVQVGPVTQGPFAGY